MTEKIRVGVIGGSGVYQIEALQNVEEVTVTTPFGAPSDRYMVGTLDGQRLRLFWHATVATIVLAPPA
ncbi:MAG: hypothetical protein R2867_42640 [Caldilineaceae bacterium]